MRAAVVTGFDKPLQIQELPVPELAPGQLLVRMHTSGLCHTDIHAARGDWPVKPTPPFIPGHEGVGVVEAVGEGVSDGWLGKRVAIPWLAAACGRCRYCLTGWETLCERQLNSGYSVNGSYAEYAAAARSSSTIRAGTTARAYGHRFVRRRKIAAPSARRPTGMDRPFWRYPRHGHAVGRAWAQYWQPTVQGHGKPQVEQCGADAEQHRPPVTVEDPQLAVGVDPHVNGAVVDEEVPRLGVVDRRRGDRGAQPGRNQSVVQASGHRRSSPRRRVM